MNFEEQIRKILTTYDENPISTGTESERAVSDLKYYCKELILQCLPEKVEMSANDDDFGNSYAEGFNTAVEQIRRKAEQLMR